jgi:hypothetical protein
MREWSGIVLIPVLMLAVVLLPTAAMGQVVLGELIPPVERAGEKPKDGVYITPSLSIGELYDDNLFFSSTNRKQDFFTRVSPGIQAGYLSTPFTFMGGYSSDSEFYHTHQELDTLQMRQRALVDIKTRPNERLRLSARGTYFKTNAPWEINNFTAVSIRRIRAERLAFDPSIAYRFDPKTTATGDVTVSRDSMDAAISIDSFIARLALDRRVSETDTFTPGYIGRRFEFRGSGRITSHAPTLGWMHEFTPLTSITLRAGPRFTEGSLDDRPEALLSINHKLTHGAVSLTYSNIQTTIVGQPFPVIAESIGLAVTYDLSPRLKFAASPTAIRVTAETFKSTIYVSNLELTYQFTKELALKGSHQYTLMSGTFDPGAGPVGSAVEIPHNIFWLRLILIVPYLVN